jgi:hypothetical protein
VTTVHGLASRHVVCGFGLRAHGRMPGIALPVSLACDGLACQQR